MILFTFRAFQILGENLLCFAVWWLRSLKVIKCSAFKCTASPCMAGLQLHLCQTWLAPISCSHGEPQGACSPVVDQLLGAADTVWANPSTNQELQDGRLLREGRTRRALSDKHKAAASLTLFILSWDGAKGWLAEHLGHSCTAPYVVASQFTGDISACGWYPYVVFPYFSEGTWSWQFLQGSWPNDGSRFVLLSQWNWAKVEDKEK